jgi:hypothetical protein
MAPFGCPTAPPCACCAPLTAKESGHCTGRVPPTTATPGLYVRATADPAGAPIPGYTLDDCPEIIGDEIARTVAWTHGPDLSRLASQPVRLRFVMKDADLYSIRFITGFTTGE